MALESDADRLAMLTACGVGITLSHADATDWDTYGILDKEYVDDLEVQGYQTILQIRKTDAYKPGELQNAVNLAAQVNVTDHGAFTIRFVRDDEDGMVNLVLEAN